MRGFTDGADGGRTHDLQSAILALSQLSYGPVTILFLMVCLSSVKGIWQGKPCFPPPVLTRSNKSVQWARLLSQNPKLVLSLPLYTEYVVSRIPLKKIFVGLVATSLLVACGDDEDDQDNQSQDPNANNQTVEPFDEDCTTTVEPQGDAESDRIHVRTILDEAEEGDVICFVDGDYEFDDRLSVRTDNLELRGESRDGTRFDFAEQDSGAAGIDIANTDDFTLRSLSVLNTPGNGVVFREGDGVRFTDVAVVWEDGPNPNNGAYGLYPVESTNIIVEDSLVAGAADAGIYLGQSTYGVIRNNVATENVAGIEVENSSYVEVYGNEAYNNTGGILIFNLPELQRPEGDNTIVFDNHVHDNNLDNFAPEGSGIVGIVPAGSGILVVGVQEVRVFDNTVDDHRSVGVATISYDTLGFGYDDPDYYPHAERIDIFDNTIDNSGYDPSALASELIPFEPVPEIIWDGVYDEDVDVEERQNCFSGNTDSDGDPVSFANLGADTDEGEDPFDISDFDCSLPELDFDVSHLDD